MRRRRRTAAFLGRRFPAILGPLSILLPFPASTAAARGAARSGRRARPGRRAVAAARALAFQILLLVQLDTATVEILAVQALQGVAHVLHAGKLDDAMKKRWRDKDDTEKWVIKEEFF